MLDGYLPCFPKTGGGVGGSDKLMLELEVDELVALLLLVLGVAWFSSMLVQELLLRGLFLLDEEDVEDVECKLPVLSLYMLAGIFSLWRRELLLGSDMWAGGGGGGTLPVSLRNTGDDWLYLGLTMDEGLLLLLLPLVLTDRIDGVALFSLFLKSPNMMLIKEEEEEERDINQLFNQGYFIYITLRRLFNQTLKITFYLLINWITLCKTFCHKRKSKTPFVRGKEEKEISMCLLLVIN